MGIIKSLLTLDKRGGFNTTEQYMAYQGHAINFTLITIIQY